MRTPYVVIGVPTTPMAKRLPSGLNAIGPWIAGSPPRMASRSMSAPIRPAAKSTEKMRPDDEATTAVVALAAAVCMLPAGVGSSTWASFRPVFTS